MSRRGLARGMLALLGGYSLFLGAVATFAPRTFFDDFPFLAHWVERLPPYNQHLVTDVGGLYLGFALLFGWAAWREERTLSLAAACAFLLVGVIHVVFHATHLDGFGTLDGVAEITALASLLLPPAIVIWAVR